MKNTLAHKYSCLQLLPCSRSPALPTLARRLFPLSDGGKSAHAQTVLLSSVCSVRHTPVNLSSALHKLGRSGREGEEGEEALEPRLTADRL